MPWVIDNRLRNQANADVMAYLEREGPSAHDDVATALLKAANGLGEVQHYCPDAAAYSWLALHTSDCRIFALAVGMNTVAFRFSAGGFDQAVKAGGLPAPQIGTGWVEWRLGWDTDLKPWCKLAYDQLRL